MPRDMDLKDIAVLVPVKNLHDAKNRLAGVLNPEERRELAWLMLKRVIKVVSGANCAVQRVMVTNYAPAIKLGEENGFRIILEEQQISESKSVDLASRLLEKDGVKGVLRLPLDLPLFTQDALSVLLYHIKNGADVVLASSRDGKGTNALYRHPPTLFPSMFGAKSYGKHLKLARESTGSIKSVNHPGLALDVDDGSDLDILLGAGGESEILRYLLSLNIA